MDNSFFSTFDFYMVCPECDYYRVATIDEYNGITPVFCNCGSILLPECKHNILRFAENAIIKTKEDKHGAYVYVIECDNKYKVGVSVNPESRVKQLSIGSCGKLVLLYKKYFEHPYSIESLVHKKLASFKVSREWFACEYDKIVNIIDYMDNEEGK